MDEETDSPYQTPHITEAKLMRSLFHLKEIHVSLIPDNLL